MKKFIIIVCSFLVVVGCVDDYTDANPKPRLDAPTIRIAANGTNQEVITVSANRFQNTTLPYISSEGPTEFTVTVVDAPGKVSEVSVTPSVPEFGTVTLNSSTVSALMGQEVGEFKFTYTPTAPPADHLDRPLNLVVAVTDSQVDENGEPNPKTTTLTIPTTIVSCLTDEAVGTYKVTAASGNLDGGTAYTLTDLQEDSGGEIFVEITKEGPGRYVMDEMTGGVWPTYYPGRANPALEAVICGTTVHGYPTGLVAAAGGVEREFTITGTRTSGNTITITWSYQRLDAPTPANPAKGTYTLTKVN